MHHHRDGSKPNSSKIRAWFFSVALVMVVPAIGAASRCEISGDVGLWNHDSCLWAFETHDTAHPGVTKCVIRNYALTKRVGSCKAKRIFKDRICALGIKYREIDTTHRECMDRDAPLGPSVRDGGI